MSLTDIRVATKLKYQEGLTIIQILHPCTESDDLVQLEKSYKEGIIESQDYQKLTPDGTNYISQIHSDMEHAYAVYGAFSVSVEDRAALLIAIQAYSIELVNNKDAVAYFEHIMDCTVMMLKAQSLADEDLVNKYLKTSTDTTVVTLEALAKFLDISPLVDWTESQYAAAINAALSSM